MPAVRPRGGSLLHLLWLAPIAASVPALVLCWQRRYRESDLVAIADWLGGGRGLLLALHERADDRWTASPMAAASLEAPLPRLRPQRLAALIPAAAFLAAALWAPQRIPVHASGLLADGLAADLESAVAELKAEELITDDEEKKLEEEIEAIRRAAEKRVDAGAWEAADALRERMAAAAAEKQDAAAWAEDALSRYASAVNSTSAGQTSAASAATELSEALQKLAAAGLLDDASAELKAVLRGGKLPSDQASLEALQQSLAMCLGTKGGRGGRGARAFGRFDPAEFPIDRSEASGTPGSGGVTRGRADAALTRGAETLPHDRFKAQPLPPGAARSPDDWAPVAALPGTPQADPALSSRSRTRQYRRHVRPGWLAAHARAASSERGQEGFFGSEPAMSAGTSRTAVPRARRGRPGQDRSCRRGPSPGRPRQGGGDRRGRHRAARAWPRAARRAPGPRQDRARQGALAAAVAARSAGSSSRPTCCRATSSAATSWRSGTGARSSCSTPGPVFANLLLADEINRASPKTQSALLEAMQERRVTAFGETRPLPAPFFVLATQNPIELEGTYPLPEAQLDRFMFHVQITGVERAVLEEILLTRVHGEPPSSSRCSRPRNCSDLFALVDAIHLPRGVASYIARLVAASHPTSADAPEIIRRFVKYGASPRAAISIGAAARGLALLRGKPAVGFDEVRRIAVSAMAHRLVLDYATRLEGWDGRRVVGALLEAVPELERGLPQTLEAR